MAGLDTRGLADGFMKGFSFVDGYYDKEQQKERQARLDQEQRDYRAQQQANWDRNFGLQEQRAQTQDEQWNKSFGLQMDRFEADKQHQGWQRGRTERQDAIEAEDRQRTKDLQDIQIELARMAQGMDPTENGIELFSNPKYQQYNPLRIASPDMGEALNYAEQVMDPNSPADTNSPEGRRHLNYVLLPDLNTGRNGEPLKGGVRKFAGLYPGQKPGTFAIEVEMEDGRLAPITEKRGSAEEGDDTILEEPVEKLVNQVQGYRTLRQALTSPQGQQGVARLRQALGLSNSEAPDIFTMYDKDGNEVKAYWDRATGMPVQIGGSKKDNNFSSRDKARLDALNADIKAMMEQGYNTLADSDRPEDQAAYQQYQQAVRQRDALLNGGEAPKPEPTPEQDATYRKDLMERAQAYAEQQIKDRSGWLSTDKTDFAQFGGDITQARDYYINRFIQMETGGQQAPAANPLGALEEQFGKR